MALPHQRAHLRRREDGNENDEYVIKTVYTTLDKTFDGPIRGYATLVKNQVGESTLTVDPEDVLSAIVSQTGTFDASVIVTASGSAPLPAATTATGASSAEMSNTSQTSRPTSTSESSTGGDAGGTSAGVKAGIAFGVLGGVLAVALLVYFAFSRRKKRTSDPSPENGSEKFDAGAAGASRSIPMKTNNRAPRVSLRPVTQFFPFNNNNGDRRSSRGGGGLGLSLGSAAGARSPSPNLNRPLPSPNPFERPGTSQSTHSLNPFGVHAERPVSPISEEASMYSRRSPSPVSNRSVAGVAASGTRQTSMHVDIDQMDFTLPPPSRGAPSPTGTEFSMTSVSPGANAAPTSGSAAIAAAGGPRNTAVHRVQLDFKPTLEDELELKGGELVRLLHEYDDGWALCIRLDRSRQGVVPRTCLSTRPVKPRTPPGASRNGPPVNPQNPSFPYQQGRSESPARPRTATGPGGYQNSPRYGQQQRGPGGLPPGQAM